MTGCSKRSSAAAVADPVSKAAMSPRRVRFLAATFSARPQCLRVGAPEVDTEDREDRADHHIEQISELQEGARVSA